MKLFLLVLLAGVWSTAVTAAPSSLPSNFPFQLSELNFAEYATLFQDDTVECVKHVVSKLIAESEFKSIWDDTKTKLNHLANVEWPKCQNIQDNAEKTKCQVAVFKSAGQVLNSFFSSLSAANALELANKIKEEIFSQCLNLNNVFEIEELHLPNVGKQICEMFECTEKVLDKVSKAHGLESLWAKSQPQYSHYIDQWKQCESVPSKVLRYICEAKAAYATYFIATEYIKLATAQDPKFIESFTKEYKQSCSSIVGELIGFSGLEIEEFQAPAPGAFLERFECVAKVLQKVSKALNLQTLWDSTQPKLDQHLMKWKQCAQISSSAFRYICEIKEGAASFVVITEYVKLATAQNPKFQESFGAEYKQTCVAKAFVDELMEMSSLEIEGFQNSTVDSGSYLTRFECVAKSLQKVSKALNLGSLWDNLQLKLNYHLLKWKQCSKYSNAALQYLCKVKEGATSFTIITEYVKSANAQNPKFQEEFENEYKKSCAGKSFTDEFFKMFAVDGVDACVQKLVQKLKCISDATSEAVHGTNFEKVWAEAKNNLDHLLNDLDACTNLPTTSEAAKCITNQLKGSYSVFVKFLSKLNEANYDAYNKVKENIKKKCYA